MTVAARIATGQSFSWPASVCCGSGIDRFTTTSANTVFFVNYRRFAWWDKFRSAGGLPHVRHQLVRGVARQQRTEHVTLVARTDAHRVRDNTRYFLLGYPEHWCCWDKQLERKISHYYNKCECLLVSVRKVEISRPFCCCSTKETYRYTFCSKTFFAVQSGT